MKYALPPLGRPGDPFGDDTPRSIEASGQAQQPGPIKLVATSFLPPVAPVRLDPGDFFSAFGARTSEGPVSNLFAKIKLAPISTDDFPGLGDEPMSVPFGKIKLAPLIKGHFPGLDDAPEIGDATFTKGADADFHKFGRFTKIQETSDGNIEVWGIATHEKPDLDNETCHYDTAKDAYQEWSVAAAARTSAAGQQISLGPIRYQHSAEPAGKATKIQYDDDNKAIWLGSVPINDTVRNELQQGFLTGYSQGGSYSWRKCSDCGKSLTLQQANNYCPDCKKQVPVTFGLKRLSEVSYVDSPCTGKGFDYVKSDGTRRFVSFAKRAEPRPDGFQVVNSVRIFGQTWKHTVLIAGRTRTVLTWPDDGVLVA